MVLRVHRVLQVLLVASCQVDGSMLGLGLVSVRVVHLGCMILGLVSMRASLRLSLGLGMHLALRGMECLLVCLGVSALVLDGSVKGAVAEVVA